MSPKEYAKRRKSLMRIMGEGAIAIIPSANVSARNRDVDHPFRQDSDFHYLTGFDEPEAVAVLVPGRPHGEFLLFCREKDPVQEIWHGRRHGVEGATAVFGADDAFPITDIDDILPGLIEGREKVFYTIGRNADFDRHVMEWVNRVRQQVRAGGHAPNEFIALDFHLHELRLFKSRPELVAMRKAAKVSAEAHCRAMRSCRPGQFEYQVAAELFYEFNRAGLTWAYPPIVGGGANACILHYTENNARLEDGSLLLIDAGAECECYAADISRTFPVNGRFSPPQREVYEVVLAAQEAAIKKVRPGNHWNDPHDAAVRVLTKGLVELGLLSGRPASLIKNGDYRKFYMHRTGHWLGMDVHDVGEYKVDNRWRLLEPGMVMTVEPGLYIAAARGVPKRFHDIGIRIEDDVLVTREGCEVLTDGVPKTVAEIEALMAA